MAKDGPPTQEDLDFVIERDIKKPDLVAQVFTLSAKFRGIVPTIKYLPNIVSTYLTSEENRPAVERVLKEYFTAMGPLTFHSRFEEILTVMAGSEQDLFDILKTFGVKVEQVKDRKYNMSWLLGVPKSPDGAPKPINRSIITGHEHNPMYG